MTQHVWYRSKHQLVLLLTVAWIALPSPSRVSAELTFFEPSWQPSEYTDVRGQVLQWIEQAQLDETVEQQLQSLWPSVDLRASSGGELLDRAAETFAISDPRARALLDLCNAPYQGPTLPEVGWLADDDLAEFVRANLRLNFARWSLQNGFYDESLAVLKGLVPSDVIDPATLLFCRVVAHQQLVEPEKSRVALVQLLEHEDALPRRYRQIAKLLRSDLAGLKDESLDHVARRMNDVRRRLDLGRAGKQVQIVEQGVVDSLDRLIKKLEEQKKQCACAGGSAQSSKPMEDSRLPSMRAPMQVDQRDIGSQSGWGDLPPKEREQALQQISREFPGHYRDLIEQYFRELADESTVNPANGNPANGNPANGNPANGNPANGNPSN